VLFNSDLAVELENLNNSIPPFPSRGKARDRENAMRAAINYWNQALVEAGSGVSLTLTIVNPPPQTPIIHPQRPWAAHQGIPRCGDPEINRFDVFEADYLLTKGDKQNTSSTGAPVKSLDPNGLRAGWVRGHDDNYDGIDRRLAETSLINSNENFITEADILFFTHKNQGADCPPIQWSYQYDDPNFNRGPAPAPYYDFYSVMLHEVGHLLGLDHQDCHLEQGGNTWNNVMQDNISPGERKYILKCEFETLKMLYGQTGRCFEPRPPPP